MLFLFVGYVVNLYRCSYGPCTTPTPVIPYPHSLSCEPLLAFPRWKITRWPLPLCGPHLVHCWPLPKLCHPIWNRLTPCDQSHAWQYPICLPSALWLHCSLFQQLLIISSSLSHILSVLSNINPFIPSPRSLEDHYVPRNGLCQSELKMQYLSSRSLDSRERDRQ